MKLRDVNSLTPLTASENPTYQGLRPPADLSGIKRGSVCLIIRKVGDEQEILLIKRAVRQTDRWSGHIAFPGGRQDPGETDLETAVRETREEVGIDLEKVSTYVGPMDPRLIKIQWGRKIAMVLCPYVFAINAGHENVPVVIQESEVAAAFWYPLSALFDEDRKSYQPIVISKRLNLKGMFGAFVDHEAGEMLFDAVDIWPIYDIESTAELPVYPWRVWGITQAILQDFRKLVDPVFSSDLIRLPTFKSPDLRLWLALVTGISTRRKREYLHQHPGAGDLTNRLLEGHFELFPWVIGTGVIIRVAAAAFAVKWLLSKRNGKL